MLEVLDERVGKHSVERVRYVINNLLHIHIVKYGVISLVVCKNADATREIPRHTLC